MARPSKAHTSEDIWHLGIDDLLAAPKEQAQLAGPGPFVITLTTSDAGIAPPPKGLRTFDGVHLYQLQRGPVDQPRFLLRLGIIASEIEADAILSKVLEHYPGATKDSVDGDDEVAVAEKARQAVVPEPAEPLIEATPEALQPLAATLTESTVIMKKPEEPFHWDVDELLPDLAVTRPSRREPQKPVDRAVASHEPAATREISAPRELPTSFEPAASPQLPASREPLARSDAPAWLEPVASYEPAAAHEPSVPGELSALLEPSTPGEPSPLLEAETPAEPQTSLDSSAPLDSSASFVASASHEPLVPFEPPAFTTPESPAVDATPAAEVAATVPAPSVEAVSPYEVDAEIDYDPNAVTHEVEIPTFIFEAPEIGALVGATATPVEISDSHTLTVEAHALDAITVEAPTIDMAMSEAPTVEAHVLDVFSMEPAPVMEAPAPESLALESPAPAARGPEPFVLESPTLQSRELDSSASESPTLESPGPEWSALELPALESPTLAESALAEPALEAAGDVASDAQDLPIEPTAQVAAEPASDIPLQLPAPELAHAPTAPLAFDPAPSSTPADAPLDTAPQAAREPAPNPVADSGTLERLVEKIGALVESVDAHDRETPSPVVPQVQATSHVQPDPPRRVTPARPAERPSSPSRVPAMEVAPVKAQVIDSTQTLRALTALELADDESSQWFSIQLVLSDEQIDLEHIPSLDIFNEYRLYSVTGLDRDRVMHALRLGFFSSALAAEAVAGYMRGFFDSPSIKRVSLAEHERFAEAGVVGRKDIGATGMHAVIELAGPTPLPERRNPFSDRSDRPARGSIWSRLVAPLRR